MAGAGGRRVVSSFSSSCYGCTRLASLPHLGVGPAACMHACMRVGLFHVRDRPKGQLRRVLVGPDHCGVIIRRGVGRRGSGPFAEGRVRQRAGFRDGCRHVSRFQRRNARHHRSRPAHVEPDSIHRVLSRTACNLRNTFKPGVAFHPLAESTMCCSRTYIAAVRLTSLCREICIFLPVAPDQLTFYRLT